MPSPSKHSAETLELLEAIHDFLAVWEIRSKHHYEDRMLVGAQRRSRMALDKVEGENK